MNIKELYNGLNCGNCYILRRELELEVAHYIEGNLRFFAPQANLTCDEEYKYINWRNFGSSANENTQEELEWILDNIFDGAKPDDFVVLNYHTMLDVMNNEYGKVR